MIFAWVQEATGRVQRVGNHPPWTLSRKSVHSGWWRPPESLGVSAPRRPLRDGLRPCAPELLCQQLVQPAERPVQAGARMCQMPGEPGALRGRGLRGLGRRRLGQGQEGAPWSSQLSQHLLQGAQVGEEPGQRGVARLLGAHRRVSPALAGRGAGLQALLPVRGADAARWGSGPGPPVLGALEAVGTTCGVDKKGLAEPEPGLGAPGPLPSLRGDKSPPRSSLSPPEPGAARTSGQCGTRTSAGQTLAL